jgi:hypothetical protein
MPHKSNTTLHLEGALSGEEVALRLEDFLSLGTKRLGERVITIQDTPYEQYTPLALLDAPTEAITSRVCAFCVAWHSNNTQPHAVIVSFEVTEAPIAETLEVRTLED